MTGRAAALLVALLVAGARGPQAQAAPKALSVFPLGGQRGTALEVEVRGTGLEGTYAVWLGPGSRLEPLPARPAANPYARSPDGLEAHVQAVPDGSRVKVWLVLAPDARVGFHNLSLVSPTGVSGAVRFWVGPDAVIQEAAAPHHTAETAQSLKLPVAVNG